MSLFHFRFRKMFKCASKLKKRHLPCIRNATVLNLVKNSVKSDAKIKSKFSKTSGKNIEVQDLKVVCRSKQPMLQFQIRTNCSANEKCSGYEYSKEVEDAVNKQIAIEFKAMFAYLSMASYFGRSEVALPGCHGFFMQMHEEEHDHALQFINYQNLRGGKVVLENFEIDKCTEWNPQSAFTTALELEKYVVEKLLHLNNVAEKHKDVSVMEIISHQYIPDQEKSIFQLSSLLRRLNKIGKDGVAEYLFDKQLHNVFVKKADKSYTPNLPEGDGARKNKYV